MKAIVLYSGGLDSVLALGLIHRLGIEVQPLHLALPFQPSLPKKSGSTMAENLFREFGLKLKTLALEEEFLRMVEHPRFGRGKQLNPCIDCRVLMLETCGAMLPEFKADFIVTGEVLGQRPMSQHRQALELIDRKSGLQGLVLRPLSARCLEPTIPELKGWVSREALLGISGRGRKEQLALAREWNIHGFDAPGGGCLLTDAGYVRKLRNLMKADMLNISNLRWIQYGRYFSLDQECKMMVARNERECELLAAQALDQDILLRPENTSGPTALIRGESGSEHLDLAAAIVAYYCRSGAQAEISVRRGSSREEKRVFREPLPESRLRSMLIS